ncbi:hypothetical protein [Megalodesulfovibrio gigas]|uniref:Uncharacterized protein n=1 Tax=Megalodesulfovibrio gigas (strain ATCC 19364 / DSM 1382 / NCIMB 9332 / VKM B-1759) TaxID=1121448 RepID=T2G9K9_MEGG1|nr:hypothetical protein [Megalodesulfovibrio gigas]AGW13280.1 hypothetical protein DGI_1435 [Megalodesulfovibrio gigas DSM 1382 = ATCC 19364]
MPGRPDDPIPSAPSVAGARCRWVVWGCCLLTVIVGALWLHLPRPAGPWEANAQAGEAVLRQVMALRAQATRMLAHPDAASSAVAEFNALAPQLQALLVQIARRTDHPQTRAACQWLMPQVDMFERQTRDALAAARATEALTRRQAMHGQQPAS